MSYKRSITQAASIAAVLCSLVHQTLPYAILAQGLVHQRALSEHFVPPALT